MFVLIVQSNRAMAAFETSHSDALSLNDCKRAEDVATSCTAMENGYYDILLMPDACSAEAFSNWAMSLPMAVWHVVVDHVIGVK